MTGEERMSRLEKAVTSFIEQASEHSNEIRASVAAMNRVSDVLSRAIAEHEARFKEHEEILKTLTDVVKNHDAMIKRFDEWLRGQGPTNGKQRKQ